MYSKDWIGFAPRNSQRTPTASFYFTGSTDNRGSNSIFIPVTPLFSSRSSAICNSPAAHLNYRSLSGDLQMVHNSGLPKYIIMYTTDPFHLEIIILL